MEKKKKDKIEISLSITDIQETAFKYNTEYDYSKLSKDILGLSLGGKLNPNMKDNILGIETSLSYTDIRNDTVLTELSILINFCISNLDELIETKDDIIEIKDNDIVFGLFNISIGTLRGVLHSKLKGTPLENYPLPPISADFLKDFLFKKLPKKEVKKK